MQPVQTIKVAGPAARLARAVPFYYGWFIVLGAFLSSVVAGSMQGFGFSVYLKPMSEDLGWTRTQLTLGPTFAGLTSAFLGPKMGRLVDRYGPSKLLLATAFTGGIATLLISQVNNLLVFYVLFVLGGAVGGGVLNVAAQATVAKWFVRLRGRAMALSALGGAAPGVMIAPILTAIVLNYGWRFGWLLSSVLFFSVLLPLSFFMIRRPEDAGLLPDGAKTAEEAQAATARAHSRGHEAARSWTRREALRTKTLWLLVGTQICSGIAISGVILHEISYVRDQGFSAPFAASVLSLHAFMAMALRVPWGILFEHVPVRYGMAVIFSLCAVAIVVLLNARTPAMFYFFAFLYGASIAGAAVTGGLIMANYFGREHTGAIQGAIAPVTVVGFTGGPLMASILRDVFGNYEIAFTTMFVMFLIAAVLALLARPPAPRPAASTPGGATAAH